MGSIILVGTHIPPRPHLHSTRAIAKREAKSVINVGIEKFISVAGEDITAERLPKPRSIRRRTGGLSSGGGGRLDSPLKGIHTCMHACMHACIQTHIHTCIHTYMYYMSVCTHTCIYTQSVYIYICIHIYTHTYKYSYIHTHIQGSPLATNMTAAV
jgi:hypothetical protein